MINGLQVPIYYHVSAIYIDIHSSSCESAFLMSGRSRQMKAKATRPQPPAAKRKTAGEAESSGSCESRVSELREPVDINNVNLMLNLMCAVFATGQ